MTKHLKITVYGHVQGVGYRLQAQKIANSFGLKGFVRNQTNNTVYIEAEGSESRLLEFINWCKNGSTNARVQEVEWNESEIIGFITFDIKQ